MESSAGYDTFCHYSTAAPEEPVSPACGVTGWAFLESTAMREFVTCPACLAVMRDIAPEETEVAEWYDTHDAITGEVVPPGGGHDG